MSAAPAPDDELRTLEAELRRRFRTAVTPISVAGRSLEILHPASAEELISEDDFARDERLPYWADIWPSSIALAGHVLEAPPPPAGGQLLELGCGSGLVATAAALAGWAVLATDYYDDALRFTRVNAWRGAGASVATRHLDWRALPDDLPAFDLVVASDVLYERPYAALVASVLKRTVAPGGRALIADPGRLALGGFLDECRARRLSPREAAEVRYRDGQIRQTIRIHELTHARAG